MTEKSKEMAEKAKADLALSEEMNDLLEEDAGSGTENVSAEDMMIPFLNILQSLSPQLRKQDPAYIKNAEEGMFFNTATERLYDGEKGIVAIPVYYMRRYTEWNLREKGGGLVRDHGSDGSVVERCKKDDNGRDITADGTQIVVAGTHYVMIVDPDSGEVERAVMALSSTQLKVSRKWNTMMQQVMIKSPKSGKTINPASFYMSYLLTTVPDSNDKGSWMSLKVQPHRPTLELDNGEELYMAAREFKNAIAEGAVKAAPPPEDTEQAAAADDPGHAF